MEIPGAGVITKPGPQVQHLVDVCRSQVMYRREAFHEALIVGYDRGDLCLLQHDFGNPNTIWRGILLPGQVMPTFGIEPGENFVGGISGVRVKLTLMW